MNLFDSRSIRGRLTLAIGLSISVSLLLGGLVLSTLITRTLTSQFDQSILEKAQALATLTKTKEGILEIDFADEFMPQFEDEEGPEYFEIRLANGELLEKSESLQNRFLDRLNGLNPEPLYSNQELPSGWCRLIQLSFVPQMEDQDIEGSLNPAEDPDRAVTLLYARNRENLDAVLGRIKNILIGLVLVLTVLIILLLRQMIRIGLQPLNEIASSVARLNPRQLQKIDIQHVPLELETIVAQLNHFIDDLRKAIQKEIQFTSDVSHELRTPIAELRSLSEVGAKWPEDVEAIKGFFQDTQTIAIQMEKVVQLLLYLSRCDNKTLKMEPEPCDLPNMVKELWSSYQTLAQTRGVDFHLNSGEVCPVCLPNMALELIVGNLLENAATYARRGSMVTCHIEQDSSKTQISIMNPVDNLELQDLESMFHRFWRKDQARSEREHTGLGLALVKALADMLQLSVHSDLAHNRFSIVVVIPAKLWRILK